MAAEERWVGWPYLAGLRCVLARFVLYSGKQSWVMLYSSKQNQRWLMKMWPQITAGWTLTKQELWKKKHRLRRLIASEFLLSFIFSLHKILFLWLQNLLRNRLLSSDICAGLYFNLNHSSRWSFWARVK